MEELHLHERFGSPRASNRVLGVEGCGTTTRPTLHKSLAFFRSITLQKPTSSYLGVHKSTNSIVLA